MGDLDDGVVDYEGENVWIGVKGELFEWVEWVVLGVWWGFFW